MALGVGFGSVAALSQDDVFRATSIGLLLSGGVTIAVDAPPIRISAASSPRSRASTG